jgi:hypothetical protein
MVSIGSEQLIEAASFKAEFMAGAKEIGAARTLQRYEFPDHDLARNRRTPGDIVDLISVGPINHSSLAVKFVHPITTKNPLIRLESTHGL